MNQGIFKPGEKASKINITCKEDALSILEEGYQLTIDIFTEIQRYLPNIFIAGIDKKIIANCKVAEKSLNKDGKKMIKMVSNENPRHTWATPANDLCERVNNNHLLLAFSE